MVFLPPPLAFIDGLGGPEIVLILVIVLVLFGGDKLPEFARGLGKTMREFKKAAAGVEEEFKRALEEDAHKKSTSLPPSTALTPISAAPLAHTPSEYQPAIESAPPAIADTPHIDEYSPHALESEAVIDVAATPPETPQIVNPDTSVVAADSAAPAQPTAAPAPAPVTPPPPATPQATEHLP